VLSKVFGLQSGEVRDFWEQNMTMNFILSVPYTILVACLAQGGWDVSGTWHARDRREVHMGLERTFERKRP
jgi:hypothetical protein